jgi:hypothetical protein
LRNAFNDFLKEVGQMRKQVIGCERRLPKCKRLRHKQHSPHHSSDFIYSVSFFFPTQPLGKMLSFSLFFLKTVFVLIKNSKYEVQTTFTADVSVMGNSAKKAQQSIKGIASRMGYFFK